MKMLDNVEICYWLTDWCKEANLNPKNVQFYIDREKKKICICTALPGWLIGPKGNRYEKYKNNLKEIEKKYKCEKSLEINLIETTEANYWVDYDYMGDGM